MGQAVDLLRDGGCPQLLMLHCVSLYPTPDNEANLLRMVTIRETYGMVVGFSDHTRGCEAALAATALGAVLIEKHFALDRSLPGPDHALSADPAELADIVDGVRKVAAQLGSAELLPSAGEARARREFRRSVVAAVDIPQGAILNQRMLCLKRPGTGIHPREMPEIIGRTALTSIGESQQIRWDDLDPAPARPGRPAEKGRNV